MMKKFLALLLLVSACYCLQAETFTVTSQSDNYTYGNFRTLLREASIYGASKDTIVFAENVDTVYISYTYIDEQIRGNILVNGEKADGSNVVFYFQNGYYMHLYGIYNIEFRNVEFANEDRNSYRKFNLASDNSEITTCAVISVDFSNSGKLIIDNCTFNYYQSNYYSQGGALICFGEYNEVLNSRFNFTDIYSFASENSSVQPAGNMLYMQGSLLANCIFTGTGTVLQGEQIQLKGGVVYCDAVEISNCKFNNLIVHIYNPSNTSSYYPQMSIQGGILYAQNADIINCEFNNNEVGSFLNDLDNSGENCMAVQGGIVYANNCSIRKCKINDNEVELNLDDLSSVENYTTINGGGLYMENGIVKQSYIQNNTLKAKRFSHGGGVFLNDAEMENCLIADNKAILLRYRIPGAWKFDTDGFLGGGIYATSGTEISFCTIAQNFSQNNNQGTYNLGGGIASATDTDITMEYSVIWNNSGTQYRHLENDTYPTIWNMRYSASTGPVVNQTERFHGNFRFFVENIGSSTPLYYAGFMDPDNGNYKISSESDCIDAALGSTEDIQGKENSGDIGCYGYWDAYGDENNIVYVKEGALGYGSSWEDATGDLQAALSSNALNSNEIWVAKGTYYPSYDDVDVYFNPAYCSRMYGGFAGNETMLDQRDIDNNPTILSGNLPGSANNAKKIICTGYGSSFVLNGFTISGASEMAIKYISSIQNCKITGNNCTSSIIHTGNIQNCRIYDNTFTPEENGTSILDMFDNCTETSIYNNTVNLFYSVENNNYQSVIASQWSDTIKNSKIYNNTVNLSFSTTPSDIVILNGVASLKTANNVEITDNSINVLSGGTYPTTMLVIEAVRADYLTNGTICGNSINIDETFTDISNARITKDLNSIHNLYNTVCWNNTTNFSENDVSEYSYIKKEYYTDYKVRNLAYQGAVEGYGGLECTDCIELANTNSGTNSTLNYPNFNDPNNGDYSLKSGSALIDGGANYLADGITTDITGENRILGDSIDIGAYEYKPYVTPDENGIAYIKENGTGDGSSWENAAANVAKALEVTGVQQIWVAAGTYYPTETTDREISFEIPNNMKLYGGFAGNETSIGQRDIAANETILSGNIGERLTERSYRVVRIKTGADENTIIDGFTVRDGYHDGNIQEIYGVGIYNYGGLISNCNVTNNYVFCDGFVDAPDRYIMGVGIYNNGGIIRNCEITNNHIEIDYYKSYTVDGTPEIQITGVGIYNMQNGIVENCYLKSNGLSGSADALSGKYFYLGLRGGAIFSTNGSVSNSVFKSNLEMGNVDSENVGGVDVKIYGAGIYASNTAVNNCMFNQNYAYATANGTNATADSRGAAVYARNNSEIINCTMVNQFINATGETITEQGAAIYIDNASVKNCIAWNSFSNPTGLVFNNGGSISYTAVEDSLFSGDGNMLLSPDNTGSNPDSNYVAFVNISGGDNLDLSLQPESACIDAGNNAYVTASGDINDSTRIQGPAVDMGCYESYAVPTVPTNVSIENQVIGGTGCYGATQTIVVAEDGNEVRFQNASNTNLIAGQSIRFLPGTVIEPGAYVHAWITTNETFCDALPESIVRVQEPEEKSLEIIPEVENEDGFEPDLKTLKVYPNPSDGRFTIETTGIEGSCNVIVYNNVGAVVYKTQMFGEKTLELFNLRKGSYIVKAINNKNVLSQQIIIR